MNSYTKLLIGASSLAFAMPALAQVEQSGGGIEEIIVTAQKRAENIQDVPIAIAAISGSELASRGVSEITQLANYTPSVQLSNSSQIVGAPSSLSGFIRGIGQDDFAVAFEPGVGVYVDGVYLARTVGANANLLDVERIEILKGPQGTLFGRNTIGGAISVVTREPSATRGIRGQFTVGRFNRIDAGIAVDLPLIEDKLLSSFAFSTSNRDGYQKRIPFPGAANFVSETPRDFLDSGIVTGVGARGTNGGGNEINARGKLLWKGTDGLRITLAADYTRARQSASAYTLIKTDADPRSLSQLYNACIGLPGDALAGAGLAGICNTPRIGVGTAIGSVNVDGDPTNDRLPYDGRYVTDDIDKTYATGNNFSHLRNYGLAATIDLDLSDDIALKSITAYRNQRWNIGLDIDGSPVMLFEPAVLQKQKQFSQELQLSGNSFDNRLKWLVGVYYFNEKASEQQNPIFAGGLFQIYNPASFKTKSYAAFTHLNFEVTEQLSFTVGARYTEERKSFLPSQKDINLFLQKVAGLPPALYPDPTDLSQLLPTARQKQKFTDFSPRLGVEFKPVDDVMLYGSFSRGYKSGGWTTRVTFPVMAVPTFDEETAKTFEVGVKSQLLDRRLQLNAAAYTTKYDGIQLSIQRGVSPTFENAGAARIKGVEVEAQAVLTDAFRLNASAGYIDAKYTRVDDPTGIITIDSALPKVAKWTAHFGPEYRIALPADATVTLRGDYFYRSRTASDAENTPELFGKAVSVVDLSATYSAADDAWSLSVGGKNVFDKRYIVNGTNQFSTVAGGVGFITGVYNRPAEWYATLRFKI